MQKVEIDFDFLFYMYCIEMRRSSEEFWRGSFGQIVKMIDMYAESKAMQKAAVNNEHFTPRYFVEEEQKVNSLREIGGLI